MRNLLLLLASTVAFTLSRACPFGEVSNYCGSIAISMSQDGPSGAFSSVGWLGQAPSGSAFHLTEDASLKADFSFLGCQGSEPTLMQITCTNCGSGTNVLAVANLSYDNNDEPDNWLIFNDADSAYYWLEGDPDKSTAWTWGINGFYPTIFIGTSTATQDAFYAFLFNFNEFAFSTRTQQDTVIYAFNFEPSQGICSS